ncbi:MAG: hypothetical protein IK020_00235 [Clostridiales bacterium]|nr:hypothetical protein [Clostridiales bacterium]
MSENKETKVKSKKKKTAYRRMIEYRIKIGAIVVGTIALLLILFFTCIAGYSFSAKAWHVKFDPIHGYAYTYYLKKDFTPAHIVIDSCSKSGAEVTIPDTIWGARVEVIGDSAFKSSVQQVKLGKYVYAVGEGNGQQQFFLPDTYGSTIYYVTFKDKEASGFYYKANPDRTLTAYAYFKSASEYTPPVSYGGLTVSLVTEYYENTPYLQELAETLVSCQSMLPYNMVRINEVMADGINPYFFSIEDEETTSRVQNVFNHLPQIYKYDSAGNPADGETEIKLSITNGGSASGKTAREIIESYPAITFINAEQDLTFNTVDALLNDTQSFRDWLCSGFVSMS